MTIRVIVGAMLSLAGALRLGGGDAVDDELQARLAGGETVERAGEVGGADEAGNGASP